jgi:hypothetical protein
VISISDSGSQQANHWREIRREGENYDRQVVGRLKDISGDFRLARNREKADGLPSLKMRKNL